MTPTSLLVLWCSFSTAIAALAPVPQSPSATAEPTAEAFTSGLARVQTSLESGQFKRANDALFDLLFKYRESEWAVRRKLEIVDLARRCAFGMEQQPPKLAALVSGELVRWDAKSGDVEIRYTTDRLRDFNAGSDEDGADWIHPATYVDTLSIEVEFDAAERIAGDGPQFFVGIGPPEEYRIRFGESDEMTHGEDSYLPAHLVRWLDGKKGEFLDERSEMSPSYEKKGSLKVTVGTGAVTAYRDGKRILQGRRTTRESGQIGFQNVDVSRRLILKGKFQPSWPQGLIDSAQQSAREKFEAAWQPKRHLPEWLLTEGGPADTGPSTTSTAPAKSDAASGAPRKRTQAEEAAFEKFDARFGELVRGSPGRRSDRLRVARQVVTEFPSVPEGWIALVCEQLEAGDLEASQASCDQALAQGIAAELLEDLPKSLAKARIGPSFTRTFAHESANYVVKSDIDQATCVEATKVLEESYRSYKQRLAPVKDVEQRMFRVFLFAGEAGYQACALDTLGEEPESTAGVYSPLLKQPLIWNLPDRAAMFRTVRHEGFHQYLDRLVEDAPSWFNEGMAEYYELADLHGGEWKEGQPNGDHVELLREAGGRWLPLAKLFALDPDEFYGEGSSLHYAQCWLVVHCLRQGPKEAKERFQTAWNLLLSSGGTGDSIAAAFPVAELVALAAMVRKHLAGL